MTSLFLVGLGVVLMNMSSTDELLLFDEYFVPMKFCIYKHFVLMNFWQNIDEYRLINLKE